MSFVSGKADRVKAMDEIAHALHAMCQPLTALQCQLELGQINEDVAGRAAVLYGKSPLWAERIFEQCLHECVRLNEIVIAMRAMVQRALLEEQKRNG